MSKRAFVTLVIISLMLRVGTASALQLQTAPAKKPAPAGPAKTAPAQTPPAPTTSSSAVGSQNVNHSMTGRLVVEYTTSETIYNMGWSHPTIKAKLLRLDGKSPQGVKVCLKEAECTGYCNPADSPCGITDSNGSVSIVCNIDSWCNKSQQAGEHKVTLFTKTDPTIEGTGRFLVTKTKTRLDASKVTVKRMKSTMSANTGNQSGGRAKICGIKLIATSSGGVLFENDGSILVDWSPRLSSGANTPSTVNMDDLCYHSGWPIPAATASAPGPTRTWQFTAEFKGNDLYLPAPKITFNISESNIQD